MGQNFSHSVRPRRQPPSSRPARVEVEVISRPFRAAHIGVPQLRHRYAAYTHTSHAAGRVVLGSTLVRMCQREGTHVSNPRALSVDVEDRVIRLRKTLTLLRRAL